MNMKNHMKIEKSFAVKVMVQMSKEIPIMAENQNEAIARLTRQYRVPQDILNGGLDYAEVTYKVMPKEAVANEKHRKRK